MPKVNPRTSKSTRAQFPEPVLMDYSSERIMASTNSRQDERPAHPERFLHYHNHFELLYITKGVRCLWSGGREYRAEAGDLIVFRPGEPHIEYAGTRTVSYFALRFQSEDLASSHVEFPGTPVDSPILNLAGKPEFVTLFNQMRGEFERPDEDAKLLLGAYLVEFVVKLRRAVRATAGDGRKPGDGVRDRIGIAAALLQEDVSGAIALEKLANRTFMSVSHFAHSFKACIGESPRRYQIHERIQQAKTLLLETEKPASEIALQLGYSSTYFFYRQFRAKTGYTALQFRREFRSRER